MSLQDRRDFVAATYYNRIQRLNPEQHPVAAALRDWREVGAPHGGASVSFLPRGAALGRRLCRFSEFDFNDQTNLERIPTPVPRKGASYKWPLKDKENAKAAHIKLANRLNTNTDIVVYTDGSACPNPGRIGIGVSARCGAKCTTYGQPIGIGSNITWRLD
jgi:hypothetical protein